VLFLLYNFKTVNPLIKKPMLMRIFRVVFLMIGLFSLLSSQLVSAKQIYRWVGEDGEVYFSDQIRPKDAKHSRASLSKTGRVLEITEEAKTKEQQEQDKRLEELRKEADELIAHQKIYDKALLSTYNSKEEMLLAIHAKTEMLNKQKNIIEGNLSRFTEQLAKQQKEASNFEQIKQPVPESLSDELALIHHRIEYTNEALSKQIEKQAQIKKIDESDVARFLFLTQSSNDLLPKVRIPSIQEANELGLFYCENDHECKKAWEIGGVFVKTHSTTATDIYNEKLIMNRPPPKDSDISLSLSKLAVNDDDYQLFLDIRCRDSLLGNELCASKKVENIRSSFRAYVNDVLSRDALSSKVPTP
jgi:hypothetical protein